MEFSFQVVRWQKWKRWIDGGGTATTLPLTVVHSPPGPWWLFSALAL